MPDLIFATRGQAEALAAQEAQAKKSREVREEFEKGAKATQVWDNNTAKLARTSETALRAVRTEQEKIADQIAVIQERQEKGIGTTAENEEAIKRLRERWVELDDATIKQREAVEAVKEEHARLKTAAESALRGVQTEEEKVADQLKEIEEQIGDIEDAMKAGLIPPEEAAEGIERLKTKMGELANEAEAAGISGGKVFGVFKKAFDPVQILKVAVSFVGVKAAIAALKAEIADIQTGVDKRVSITDKLGLEAEAAIEKHKAGEGPAPTKQQREDYQRYQQRQAIRGGIDSVLEDFARAGDATKLSTQELEKISDVLREAGQTNLSRSIKQFVNRLDDGSVSLDEVIGELRTLAEKQKRVSTGLEQQGLAVVPGSRPATAAELSQLPADQRRSIELLERMADHLQRIEQGGSGLVGTGE